LNNSSVRRPAELESAAEWPVNVTRDESSMGDQDDLPLEKHEELQPSRLHKENQPMKQLEEVIQEIRELMLKSVKKCQQGEAGQRRTCTSSRERCNNNKAEEQEDNSRRNFGIQEDFNRAGKLMSRSS
jgi:hypothetical protein